ALCFPMFLFAQKNAADKLFEKYADTDGFTTISFSSGLMKMVADMDDEKDDNNILRKIDEIRILTSDNENSGLNFYEEIVSDLAVDEYEELITIKDKDTNVKIWIKEDAGIIRELILVSGGLDDNALIIVRGEIELNKLSGLGESLNVNGLSVLNKL
ncbi:MAG: DUF4252 domain-containing protein, partial [Bacteroidales bacterium]|nr:DUF4252 domain-containing protein [Bacteroidales bacterium]